MDGLGDSGLALALRVAAVLDSEIASTERVTGGDVAQAYRMTAADGRVVFAKTHRDPPPDFFEIEAAGLEWLRSAAAVAVPEVLGVAPGLLVLEWIQTGAPHRTTDDQFGRALAALHRTGAPSFGRQDCAPTGSRRLPNDPCDTWTEFYAARRLEPLARLARDEGAVDQDTLDRVGRIAARLDRAGAADEPARRLHGDLWAGNRLVDEHGTSWLIDPAAHGGHREFDLAMMQLFGGFGPDCFVAYRDEFPLAAGWEDRTPLHQLAPLLVHAIKFGGSYAEATRRAVGLAEAVVA